MALIDGGPLPVAFAKPAIPPGRNSTRPAAGGVSGRLKGLTARFVWLVYLSACLFTSLFVYKSPSACAQAAQAATNTSGSLRRIHHPWGRFEPGAWAVVKETTETYSEEGKLVVETEVKATLLAIDLEGVTLQVEPKILVGGKPMPATTRTIRQGFHGEPADETVRVLEDKEATVDFLGRSLPCRLQRLEIQGVSTRAEVSIFYGNVPPYIYRREVRTFKLEDGSEINSQVWEVVGRSCRLLALIQDTYQVKITHKSQQGTRITLATISPEVPGAVITQTTMEFNAAGQLFRKTSSELLEYGYELKSPRGFLRLWRPRPFRR